MLIRVCKYGNGLLVPGKLILKMLLVHTESYLPSLFLKKHVILANTNDDTGVCTDICHI
jgi:hypothetical protein